MGRRYRSFSTFSPSDSNTICDVTGFKTKISQVVRRWEGFMVIPAAFHPRQPQDFPVIPVPQTTYPVRIEQDQFDSEDACNSNIVWAQQTSGVTTHLKSVWEESETWVVVGDLGVILVSTNAGETWSQSVSGVSKNLRAVKYWNGYWWAVGNGSNFVSATVLKSTDAITWEAVSVGPIKGFFVDIAINDTTMAFLGYETEDFLVYTFSTTDGLSFTENDFPFTLDTPYSIRWNEADSLWGAVGDTGGSPGEWFGTSSDLITWTKVNISSGNKITAIDHDGTNWLVSESPTLIYTSPNAASWTQRPEENMDTDDSWNISNDGICVILLCGGDTTGKIILSTDNGATWELTYTADSTVTDMRQAHYSQGNWVAVGTKGRIITGAASVTASVPII